MPYFHFVLTRNVQKILKLKLKNIYIKNLKHPSQCQCSLKLGWCTWMVIPSIVWPLYSHDLFENEHQLQYRCEKHAAMLSPVQRLLWG